MPWQQPGLHSNCVRFLPPLDLPDEQFAEAMTVLDHSIDAVAARLRPA